MGGGVHGCRGLMRAGTMVDHRQCGIWRGGTMVFLRRWVIGGRVRRGVCFRVAIGSADGDGGGPLPVWRLAGGDDGVPLPVGDWWAGTIWCPLPGGDW